MCRAYKNRQGDMLADGDDFIVDQLTNICLELTSQAVDKT